MSFFYSASTGPLSASGFANSFKFFFEIYPSRQELQQQLPHHAVVKDQAKQIWLYDRNDFPRRVSRNFSQLLLASQQINRYQENGMWLVLKTRHSLGSGL